MEALLDYFTIPEGDIGQLKLNEGSVKITNCEYNEEGEWNCETTMDGADLIETDGDDLIQAQEDELSDVNQQMFDIGSLLTPLYDVFSMFSRNDPDTVITYQDGNGEELPDLIIELVDSDYADDQDGISVFSDGFLDDIIDEEIWTEDETGIVFDFDYNDIANWYFGFENTGYEDIGLYYEDLEDVYGSPCHHMKHHNEIAVEPASSWLDNASVDWQGQILLAVMIAFVGIILARIVVLCRRSLRLRSFVDQTKPLLNVGVETGRRGSSKIREAVRSIGSYVPPTPRVMKKVVVDSEEKEPYIVFI